MDDAIARRRSAGLRDHLGPRTRRQWTLTGLGALLAAFLLLDFLTMPPPMPDYAEVRAALAAVRGVAVRPQRRADRFARESISRGGGSAGPRSTRSRRRSPKRWSRRRTTASTRMAGSIGWRRSARCATGSRASARAAPRTLSMQVAAFLAPDLAAARRARLARQDPPDARRARDRRRVEQGPDPRSLSQPRRLSRRGAGDRRRGARAVRQDARCAEPRRCAAAGRRLLPDPQASAPTVARRACALAREKDCARFDAAAVFDARPGAQPAARSRASRRTSRRGC